MRAFVSSWKLQAGILAGFLFLVMLVVPLLVNTPAFWSLYRYGVETGPIGDTIGGMTAPFIGVLSALLLYSSFKAQVEANKLQSDELANQQRQFTQTAYYNALVEQLADLTHGLDSLVYEGVYEDSEVKSGTEGLVQFRKDVVKASEMDGFVAELHYRSDMTRSVEWLVEAFRDLIQEIEAADLDANTKRLLLLKMRVQFRIHLQAPLAPALRRITRLEGNDIFEQLFREVQRKLNLEQWIPDFRFARVNRTPGFPTTLDYDSDTEKEDA